MDSKNTEKLLDKYLQNDASPEEVTVIESWYITRNSELKDELSEPDYQDLGEEIWNRVILNTPKKHKTISLWPKLVAAAAAILIFVSVAYFIVNEKSSKDKLSVGNIGLDIAPGKTTAILTLANGKQIKLDEGLKGKIASEEGIAITRSNPGGLTYRQESAVTGGLAFNTLATPRGGQHQLTLPDGTEVWLNAATTLRFPVNFKGKASREVELSGEAYFQVAKDSQHPFIVKTINQRIEVLGTHFNVQAYEDDNEVTSTLLEGKVRVSALHFSANRILSPGEESVLENGRKLLQTSQADIEGNMAWKNGYFIFNNEDFESILKKVSRWYDVEISYEQHIPDFRVGGRVSRSKNLSSVLKALELTGQVHFKVQGRRIIVEK